MCVVTMGGNGVMVCHSLAVIKKNVLESLEGFNFGEEDIVRKDFKELENGV